MEKEEK